MSSSGCAARAVAPQVVAAVPPEAGGESYDVSLKVTLALAHYHLGLPFKRIESYQALVGTPLPDATRWAQVEEVAGSAYPVYETLQRLGANQPLVYQDDTGARVLSLMEETLIEACRLNGANPLHYLSALMANRSAVFAAPGAWWPWNDQERLDTTAPSWPLSHPPPVLGQSSRLGVTFAQ